MQVSKQKMGEGEGGDQQFVKIVLSNLISAPQSIYENKSS